MIFTSTSRDRRITLGVISAFLVFVPSGAGCAMQEESANTSDGFMITGPAAHDDFDLAVGDTLPELAYETVPAAVSSAAANQARSYGFRTACTRFFHARDNFVALLVKDCEPDVVVEDGRGMAAYRADGSPVGRATPWLTTHYTEVVPRTRPPGQR